MYDKEVSSPSKRESLLALVNAKLNHGLRFGAGADRTRGQAASTEATVFRMAMSSKAEWAFHITDPLGSGNLG